MNAPDNHQFNDFNQFKFKMHNQSINQSREEIFVSPIALAVNIGDYALLDSLLEYLKNIQINNGLEARTLNPPIINNKLNKTVIRRRSPLQYACSLGLY
jgi:hypothetical protein